MVAAGWSDAQKRAYAIADNKLALNAGWDEGLLRLELGELRNAPSGTRPSVVTSCLIPSAGPGRR
jgi:hypothetical protein